MKKYNLSVIMKKAWAMYTGKCGWTKPYSKSFAECLHLAWVQAKNGCFDKSETEKKSTNIIDKKINGIAAWFLNKNFSSNERIALQQSDIAAVKETAKAYLVKAVSDFGTITAWVPKSVCF